MLLLADRASVRMNARRLAADYADEIRSMATESDERADHVTTSEERAYLLGEADAYRHAATRLGEIAEAARPFWTRRSRGYP
ncbi:hypothetical protein ACQEU3_46045 [Spirillospora sp. CA-253888]